MQVATRWCNIQPQPQPQPIQGLHHKSQSRLGSLPASPSRLLTPQRQYTAGDMHGQLHNAHREEHLLLVHMHTACCCSRPGCNTAQQPLAQVGSGPGQQLGWPFHHMLVAAATQAASREVAPQTQHRIRQQQRRVNRRNFIHTGRIVHACPWPVTSQPCLLG